MKDVLAFPALLALSGAAALAFAPTGRLLPVHDESRGARRAAARLPNASLAPDGRRGRCAVPGAASADDSSTRLFASSSSSSSSPPPPLATEGDWSAYLDDGTTGTGLAYYFNGVTGESLWEPPTATFPDVELGGEKARDDAREPRGRRRDSSPRESGIGADEGGPWSVVGAIFGGGADGGASSSSSAADASASAPAVVASSATASASASGESDEEAERLRRRRLEVERRAELEAGEVRRASRVREDRYAYLALFALQLLPLVGLDRWETVLYFLGTAVLTVYVGGRQEIVGEVERVTKENALYAPVGASVAIGLLYALIKLGLDPTALYAVAVSLIGAVAISDVGVPILRNVLPEKDFAAAEVEVPRPLAKAIKLDPPTLPVDGLATLGLGLAATAAYWAPVAMTQKFMVSNAIAWALAMTSLGAISLGSFQTGAVLLAGLFCYDIFWVFGTDVMMTVATKVEAPVKFLYASPPDAAETKSYPFSVLGLGDVVIPGLFVRFMSKVDRALQPAVGSYFGAATAAYAVGLASCFAVNEITHAGQPALLYLDPACVGSALAVGAANGQLAEVWNFEDYEKEEEEEAASELKE